MPYKDIEKQKIAQRESYLRKKAEYRLKDKVRRRKTRQIYYDYLLTLSCEECGENHPACLDFDHIDPTTKVGKGVGSLVRTNVWNKVKEEIDKCRVLCANCHRKRTAEQFDWYSDLKDTKADVV